MASRDYSLSLFERFLSIFTKVRAGEGRCVAVLLLHAFLLMFAYYLIRPVREALILTEGDAELRSYAVAAQAALLMALIPLYGWLYRLQDNSLLIQRVNGIFIACLVIFAALGSAGVQFGFVFFVWASIFGVMVVAQFWAFATDLFNVKSGQRLFAIIAVGVSAGAWVGARTAGALFEWAGPHGLMLLAAAVLASTLLLSRWSEQAVPEESRSAPLESEAPKQQRWLGGFAIVVRDHYLVLIALLVILLNWITATGEYVLSDWLVEVSLEQGEDARQEFIGTFMADFFASITLLGFLVQILLVSRLIMALGLPVALLITPAIFFGGYLLIGFLPVFALVQWVLIVQKSLDYSLLNTTRNALLLPTERSVKYEAKTAIDTFFYRMGDLLSAGSIFIGARVLDLPREQFIVLNTLLALAMVVLAWRIGREYAGRAKSPTFNLPPRAKEPIPDVVWRSGESLLHQVSPEAFVDADPGDVLTLSARCADGSPLPQWVVFDAMTRTFRGRTWSEVQSELVIEVVASDFDGAVVTQTFILRTRGG